MKVLVVGSGGREHAIAWSIARSRLRPEVITAPGNPGTAQVGSNLDIAAADIPALVSFAQQNDVDLTIVGPEAPLVAGIVDRFREAGQNIVGPGKAAAALEGSKAFAKEFMLRHGIPTASYQSFRVAEEAEKALRQGRFEFPVVLKADGLAAGKGVLICPDLATALNGVRTIMVDREFGAAGDLMVIEEFLVGEEASFMVFTDGRRFLPMVPSQDHKAALDGDRGPNTGGMGAYSVDSILSEQIRRQVLDSVIVPTIEGMADEGSPYTGILYAGLMLTPDGPKVLEFNVRLGDPETQVVLPRLKTDLLSVMDALGRGDLSDVQLSWSDDATVTVVVASEGYPGRYPTGREISGLSLAAEIEGTVVFHAGTASQDNKVVTAGGRVLAVTARARSLPGAVIRAYEGVNKIHFEGMHYRRDIASRGLGKE